MNAIYRQIFHNYTSYHLRYGDENLQPKVAEVATLYALLPIYQSDLNVNIEIRCNSVFVPIIAERLRVRLLILQCSGRI